MFPTCQIRLALLMNGAPCCADYFRTLRLIFNLVVEMIYAISLSGLTNSLLCRDAVRMHTEINQSR